MSEFIQCQPGPTDAELEAERDAKHAIEVAWWMREHPELEGQDMLCENCTHPASDHTGQRKECTGIVTDSWGSWLCGCPQFVADPDA